MPIDRKLFEQPFPETLIKTRRGPFGQTFSYVEGAEYIRRLNDAADGEWSFEVLNHEIRATEVVVLARLTIGEISKTAFGGSTITVSREGELLSIADDLKAAATDALKKACSLLGVGLHLYAEPVGQPKAGGNGGNGNGRADHPQDPGDGGRRAGERLTQRQLAAIWAMARSLGQSADTVRTRCVKAFGVQPENLAKAEASTFITELGSALGAQ